MTGVGRLTHFTGLVLQERAGIQLLPVPYNGGPAAALADVGSGRVSMIIEGYSGIVGAVKAGQVKLIAVASAANGCRNFPICRRWPKPYRTLPPPAGKCWSRRSARRTTIVDKISVDLAKVMDDPDFKKRAGQYRQLFARHDARAGSRLRRQGTENLAAGGGEGLGEVTPRAYYTGRFHPL